MGGIMKIQQNEKNYQNQGCAKKKNKNALNLSKNIWLTLVTQEKIGKINISQILKMIYTKIKVLNDS